MEKDKYHRHYQEHFEEYETIYTTFRCQKFELTIDAAMKPPFSSSFVAALKKFRDVIMKDDVKEEEHNQQVRDAYKELTQQSGQFYFKKTIFGQAYAMKTKIRKAQEGGGYSLETRSCIADLQKQCTEKNSNSHPVKKCMTSNSSKCFEHERQKSRVAAMESMDTEVEMFGISVNQKNFSLESIRKGENLEGVPIGIEFDVAPLSELITYDNLKAHGFTEEASHTMRNVMEQMSMEECILAFGKDALDKCGRTIYGKL